MKSRFQMSSIGELTFFLGLQVKQKEDGIFISQDKYVAEILKKFDFVSVKTASKPIETHKPLVKDTEASDVDVHLYRSMTGSLMYLTASKPDIMFAVGKSITGRLSISWQETYFLAMQKQTIMATSTIEAEYVAAPNCCFSSWLLLIMEDVSIHKLPLVKGKQWLCWYSFYVLNKSRLQFCFTKVSTDSAIFVPMDTVSTAKEPLEKIPPRFWTSAKSQTINNVRYINAKVAGKPVTIFEASIRSDLHFNDVDRIDSLNDQAIFDDIKLMGHLDATKTFVMYPRFISIFLSNQLTNVSVPLDHFPIHALSNKVFSFMVKKGKHFSGKVKPLFPNMLVQPTEDEGEGSERPSKPQPTPSHPHPSEAHVTAQVAEIKSLKAQVKKLKKQARPFILLHKAWLRAVKRKNQNKKKVLKTSKRRSVFKQGRKTIKSSKDEGKTAKVDEKGENTAQQQSTDRIKADRLLAERVQEAKREQFTVEERAKFLHDIKVYSRAESCSTKELKPLENKPPTKNIKRFDDSFITIGSTEDERKIKEINEGASDPDKKKKFVKEDVSTKVPAKQDVAEQGTKKRKGTIDSEIMERKLFISKLDKVSSPEGDYLCWLTIVNEKFKGNIQKATRSTYDSLGRLEDYDGILNRSNKSLLSGTINKIRRLSLRDCMRLVEFAY
ncbi:putative ribonuclease H-like domain-containing protein [Tanacetum coccineum]